MVIVLAITAMMMTTMMADGLAGATRMASLIATKLSWKAGLGLGQRLGQRSSWAHGRCCETTAPALPGSSMPSTYDADLVGAARRFRHAISR